MLLSMGGRFAGFSFFVQQGRLNYVYNFFGLERYTVTSADAVPAGPVTLRMDFARTADNQGTAALFINDSEVGAGTIGHTVPLTFGLAEGLTAGRDPSTPVSESYQAPFAFSGKIKKVTVEVKADPKTVSQK